MLMNDYVLLTDSASDLPLSFVRDLDIGIIPMKYTVNDNLCIDRNTDLKNFYDMLRGKATSSTTQVNTEEFFEFFEKYLKEGKDILYIGFPLSLSGMFNCATNAARELSEIYPERKILLVDSMSASIGQGILVYYAAMMKKSGSTIEEVENWVNENKLRACHWFTVDDLHHLKRGGRISPAIAVVGSILNVKPLLSMNNEGNIYVFGKVRGRKNTLDLMSSKIENLNPQENQVFVGHGDCIEDAKYVANKISSIVPKINIQMVYLGPIIGTHTGPGTVALAFMGNSR